LQRVGLGLQPGVEGVVGVDHRAVHLRQDPRDGRGLDLLELQSLWVGRDVAHGLQRVLWILERDQARRLQQQQGAAGVGGVVGQDDLSAVGQVGQRLVLARIEAQRLDVNAGDGDQVRSARRVELVQIGLGLEVVHIQPFFRQLHVRLNVVVEDLDLDRHALGGQDRLHLLQDFSVRHGGGADQQRRALGPRFLARALTACGKRQDSSGGQQQRTADHGAGFRKISGARP